METAKQIGALLPGIVEHQGEMTSPERLTSKADLLDLSSLPARLDDGTVELLKQIVTAPLPPVEQCSDEQLARCLKSLDILPRKADDTSGKLRYALYRAKLSGYSDAALGYMTSKALEQCHWFPTIAECLTILAGFPNREVASDRKETAKLLIRREANARMDDDLLVLKNREMAQEQIDALPEFTKRVAVERCFLWACKDGTHIVRHLTPLDDATRAELEARGGMA